MNHSPLPSSTPLSKNYDHCSGSHSSLLTAGLPSESKKTSHFNQSFNQNQATDTQPIMLNSDSDDFSQCTNLSHTYFNLSQQDINDVLTALHTLAQYVNDDMNIRKQDRVDAMHEEEEEEEEEEESDHSSIVCNSLNSSLRANKTSFYHQPRCLFQHRHRSLSSNHCRCRHHVKHHRNSIKDFPNISSYPSYSSNAMFYASTSRANRRPRSIHHRALQYPSTSHLPSKEHYQQSIRQPISPLIHDQLLSIEPTYESFPNTPILPQQVHYLQVLESNPVTSEAILLLNCKAILHSRKFDVATQWSSQELTSSYREADALEPMRYPDEQGNTKVDLIRTHSGILTELSQSTTAAVGNDSVISMSTTPLLNDLSLEGANFTDTQTEQLLAKLDLPLCKCSVTNATSASSVKKKRRKSTSIQGTAKRSHLRRKKALP